MVNFLQTGIRFRLTLWVLLLLGSIWLPASATLAYSETARLSGQTEASIVALSTVLPSLVLMLFCVSSLLPLTRLVRQTKQMATALEQGDLVIESGIEFADEFRDIAQSLGRIAHRSTRALRQREQEQEKMAKQQEKIAREHQNLNHQAVHDELTGLPNRKYGRDLIAELDSTINDETHSILFIDLDGFKPINDTYGHSAGDEILVAISMRIRAILAEGAQLIRWGGDEFVIILPRSDLRKAVSMAQDVADLFKHPLAISCGVLPLGCSIGVATSTPDQTMESVLEEADGRMYQQKQRRKGSENENSASTADRADPQAASAVKVFDELDFADDQVLLKFFDSAA